MSRIVWLPLSEEVEERLTDFIVENRCISKTQAIGLLLHFYNNPSSIPKNNKKSPSRSLSVSESDGLTLSRFFSDDSSDGDLY